MALHLNRVHGILYQNLDLLPPPSPPATLPLSFWGLNPPSLTTYEQNLFTPNEFDKFTYGSSIFPYDSTPLYGTVKSPSDAIDNTLYGYYHNGRYLKQYFVAEDNLDDLNALNNYISRFMPYVPSKYNVPAASRQPNLGFPAYTSSPLPTVPSNLPISNFYSIPRALTNTAPTQLGSGSLGYIRLPNGAVYLGSGSLGYTNNHQKSNELNEIQNRQSPQAGPLTFGETPR